MTHPHSATQLAAPGPSPYAAGRLHDGAAREIADLRCRLREATLRADAYLAAGRPDAAAQVLAEQRAMVSWFNERIVAAVRGAHVEAAAEQVLTAGGLEELIGRAPAGTAPTRTAPMCTSPMRTAARDADRPDWGGPGRRR